MFTLSKEVCVCVCVHATQQPPSLLIATRDRIRGWMVCNFRPSPPGYSVDVMSLTYDLGTWRLQGR